MATYKVIQDIEAEDKLLGPLTLRQFVYAAITIVLGFIAFKLVVGHAWYIAVFFVPPAIFFGFLAAPFSHEQSSEVWMLAKIRFALKPRRRIWDQSGATDLVTITAPKIIELNKSDGLSQNEVNSRLQALASTIDSRGWIVKNSPYVPPSEDRLVGVEESPKAVPEIDLSTINDVLDADNGALGQNFNRMITESQENVRKRALEGMQKAAEGESNAVKNAPLPSMLFASKPKTQAYNVTKVSSVQSTDDEKALLQKIHEQQNNPKKTHYHEKTLQPLSSINDDPLAQGVTINQTQNSSEKTKALSTPSPVPAIIHLAERDDLNVDTIARAASGDDVQTLKDEVVVTLTH